MNAYVNGDWGEAITYFKKTLKMRPDRLDGPSATLIRVIERNNCIAPSSWRGFRELTSK